MLRITTIDEDSPTVTLKAEGRIVSDWIAALARECDDLLERGKAVDLDFLGVTFIDTGGVSVVRTLLTRGVRISQCPALIRSLLDEEDAP